jgi:hypothetical protein
MQDGVALDFEPERAALLIRDQWIARRSLPPREQLLVLRWERTTTLMLFENDARGNGVRWHGRDRPRWTRKLPRKDEAEVAL